MYLAIPPDIVHPLPMDHPELAAREFAAIVAGLRDYATAELEAIATAAVEEATRTGAEFMAVVTPPDAAPALLTGTVLDVAPEWSAGTADQLRDSLEDVGGPDVRETLRLDTALGPAVIVQRVPGAEQARDRRPLTLQLQAFVPAPGTGKMLLLTLASPAADGWAAHQLLFGGIVLTASPDEEEESFEHHTYRL